MDTLETVINNYLEYCNSQKCLDEKTLKAYRIDLRQFSEQICHHQYCRNYFQNIGTSISPGCMNNINPKP